MNRPEHPLSRQRMRHLGVEHPPECGACAEWVFCGTISAEHKSGCENFPEENDIQWHVERIADEVAGIASTHELHLPPKNDAEVDTLDARESESDKLCFGPESLLWFDITGKRRFAGKIDDDGPLVSVEFDRKMKRATVVRGDGEPRVVDAGAYDVALAILNIDEEGRPL